MTSALIKSGAIGALLTVVFVWVFGTPITWGAFVVWTFISLLVLIMVTAFLFALKWAIIIAIIKDTLGE